MRIMLLTLLLLSGCASFQGLTTTQLDGRPGELNFRPGIDQLDQPLILALHGSSGNSIQFQVQSDLVGVAKAAGYRLALLNGQEWDNPNTYYGKMRSWNSGNCCWDRPEDDIAYLSGVIANLQRGATGNGQRVVIVGHSNGSMMAYALMCARPGLIDGIVGVAGTVSFADCQPSTTRVVHIHGTQDKTVPLEGDLDLSDGRNFESLAFQNALFDSAGIAYTNLLVEGAGHPIEEVDAGLKRQLGYSISSVVLGLARP